MTNVFNIGTVVQFGDISQKQMTGFISGITIRKTYVIYEISYWLLDDLKLIWLGEDHFTVKDTSKNKEIGFKKHE